MKRSLHGFVAQQTKTVLFNSFSLQAAGDFEENHIVPVTFIRLNFVPEVIQRTIYCYLNLTIRGRRLQKMKAICSVFYRVRFPSSRSQTNTKTY